MQAFVLLLSAMQQVGRAECAVSLPSNGPVQVLCDTCARLGLTMRSFIMYGGSATVIGIGVLAVLRRDKSLLLVYGSCMLFFAFVVGLTAALTALEAPVLEVAIEGVSEDECLEMANAMMQGARDHAALAGLACVVNAAGALLAIRSKELFAYEEILGHHAAAAGPL